MSHPDTIHNIGNDAEQLEIAYQRARSDGEDDLFSTAIKNAYDNNPDNLLYAAWHFRLAQTVVDRLDEWRVAWAWAIPLAILNGLILWWLSDDSRFMLHLIGPKGAETYGTIPHILLLWTPVSAIALMTYLAVAGKQQWASLAALAAGLAILSAYTIWFYPQTGPTIFQEQYLMLMVFHLPLAAWSAVGVFLLLGVQGAENRFAFLAKSLEVFVLAGLFVIAGMVFTGITVALFEALNITLPIWAMRLLLAGGGGLIPVLATAMTYNPNATPGEQRFGSGVSQLIAQVMRVMLPLTLALLLVYLAFIPFNFRAPFENREVLISYNAMLFAVMALLLGATPVRERNAGGAMGRWLRRGIIALAIVAALVSLYALAAILYRAWQDRLTPNRLAFVGWDVVNLSILLLILWKQLKTQGASWLAGLHSAFATGAALYVVWTLVVILAVPWLFGISQGNVADLPVSIQHLIYERGDPILLKCATSPHIYLLDDGKKRWVEDIPTFEAESYTWSDVSFIGCEDLRGIPDGKPIPTDAGTPPQP